MDEKPTTPTPTPTKYSIPSFSREARTEHTYQFALNLLAKDPDRYDPQRLENAKALCLDEVTFNAKTEQYHVTIWDCNCPDHTIRHLTCKHMLAVMLDGCIFA